MSWKLKAIVISAAVAGAAFLAPPGALSSLASPSTSSATSATSAIGVVGALQSHPIAPASIAMSAPPPAMAALASASIAPNPAPAPTAMPPIVAVSAAAPLVNAAVVKAPPAVAPRASAPVAAPVNSPATSSAPSASKTASLARPKVGALTRADRSATLDDHPRAEAVPAQTPAVLSLSSRIDAALPDGGKGLTHSEMGLRMLHVDSFMALATAIENVEQRVYYDPGGTNLGMGYCVTKRVSEYGAQRVQSDLIHAGLTAAQAKALIGHDRKAHKGISLTPAGALRLLEITKPDYQGLAENAYGKEAFDKLPATRQAALTYIAYNTGNVGQFSSLIAAAHKGDHVKAMQNLAMHWTGLDGERHTNDRARAWLQAAWLGMDHLADALAHPSAFESDVGQPNNELVVANLAKPGAARDKLLARRTQASAWAFKALTREKEKDSPSSSPLKKL